MQIYDEVDVSRRADISMQDGCNPANNDVAHIGVIEQPEYRQKE